MNAPTAAGYTAEEPTHAAPWHGLVVWDVFFNALTTGLFLTVAVGELTTPAVFRPVAVWAYPLALVLLLIDLTLLVLDLGDPLRFHHMLRVFKPSSPMSLGTWCLTLYSLPLTAVVGVDVLTLLGVLPDDSTPLDWLHRVLIAGALPFAFGSMAYKGVLFSTSSQLGWRDARWLGAYHVASAFALGCAILYGLSAGTGAERATAALRPALAVLLVGQVVPLVLLAMELQPTLARRYARREQRGTAALVIGVGVIVPLALLPLGGAIVAVLVGASALGSGWIVRHIVVMLPHSAVSTSSAH
jgi:hypothetical protein